MRATLQTGEGEKILAAPFHPLCFPLLAPHHKHMCDKSIIAPVAVHECDTEAEEAVIGVPASACQPARPPLVGVRVDKERAKHFQSHIPHFFSLLQAVTKKKGKKKKKGEMCVFLLVCKRFGLVSRCTINLC